MAPPDWDRLATSLALKAGRWLVGAVDEKGRPAALTVEALLARSPLQENRITKNRLEDIEQMNVDARPMERALISQALGVDLDALRDLRPPDSATEPASAEPPLEPAPPGALGQAIADDQTTAPSHPRKRRPAGEDQKRGANG